MSMSVTFNVCLNDKPNSKGLYSVFIRITKERKHKKVKSNHYVLKDQFNPIAKYGKWIRTTHPKYAQYNKEIQEQIDELRNKAAELEKERFPVLIGIIADPLKSITLKEFCDKEITRLFSQNSYGYSKQMKSKLIEFYEFFKPDFPLSSLTVYHISEYRNHLLAKGLKNSTVNTAMAKISTVIGSAYENEIIPENPFRKNKRLKEVLPNRIKLSDSQIKMLEEGEVKPTGGINWLSLAKDMYLLSFYNAGIRIADLIQLRVGNISNTGRLEYQMDKTGFKKSISLNAKSKNIIAKYIKPGSDAGMYIFPILDSSAAYSKNISYDEKEKAPIEVKRLLYNAISSASYKANRGLKSVAKKIGLPEEISFHTARHSFADKARRAMKDSKRVSITDIQSALGHRDLATTQRYIKSFDIESLDEAMNDIFD